MATIKEKWKALVKEVRTTDKFKQVKAVSFRRTQGGKFLKSLPALKSPACIVVWLGANDTALGAHLDRIDTWSLMIVTRDAAGQAWEEGCDLIDDLRDAVLDQQILDGELTIHGSNKVGLADIQDDKIFIAEVSITTREANERE